MRSEKRPNEDRAGAVAVEFAIVASLLFFIFLGMIEVGRAMMVLSAVSNAARNGARAGAVTLGDYTAITTAVNSSLTQATISGSTTTVVMVNSTTVTDDASFRAAALPGAAISVQVSVPYGSVSWLPAGTGIFISSTQPLTETAVMCKEG
jgi:Flp pilus assembly protein TadG